MSYKDIEDWRDVPEGCHVIEDTYPELYKMNWRSGEPWLVHVGWSTESGRSINKELNEDRLADFEPNSTYDQGWFMKVEDKKDTNENSS